MSRAWEHLTVDVGGEPLVPGSVGKTNAAICGALWTRRSTGNAQATTETAPHLEDELPKENGAHTRHQGPTPLRVDKLSEPLNTDRKPQNSIAERNATQHHPEEERREPRVNPRSKTPLPTT